MPQGKLPNEVCMVKGTAFLLPLFLLLLVVLPPACGNDDAGIEAGSPGTASPQAHAVDGGPPGQKADIAAPVKPPQPLFEAVLERGRDLAPGCYATLQLAGLKTDGAADCEALEEHAHYVVEQGLDNGNGWLRISFLEPLANPAEGAPAMVVETWSAVLDLTTGAVTSWHATQRDDEDRPVAQVAIDTTPFLHVEATTLDPLTGATVSRFSRTVDSRPDATQPVVQELWEQGRRSVHVSQERDEDGVVLERVYLDRKVTGRWHRLDDPEGTMNHNQREGNCSLLRETAEERVREIVMNLFVHMSEGNPPPLHLAPFPVASSCCGSQGGPDENEDGRCDVAAWTHVPLGWHRLGLTWAEASPLFYQLQVTDAGRFEVRAAADLDCDGPAEFVVAGSFALGPDGRPDPASRSLAVSPATVACSQEQTLPQTRQSVSLTYGEFGSGARLRVDGRTVGEGLPAQVALQPGGHLLEVVADNGYASLAVIVGASGPRTIDLQPGCQLPTATDRCARPSALVARLTRVRSLADLTLFAPPEGLVTADTNEQPHAMKPRTPPKTPDPPPTRTDPPPTLRDQPQNEELWPDGRPQQEPFQVGRTCPAGSPAGRLLNARLVASWAGEQLADVATGHAAELGLEPGEAKDIPAPAGSAAEYLRASRKTFRNGLTNEDLARLQQEVDRIPDLAPYLAAKADYLCHAPPLVKAGDYAGLAGLAGTAATRAGLTKARYLELDADFDSHALVKAEAIARAICCLADDAEGGVR